MNKTNQIFWNKKRKRLCFYIALMAIPVINSVLLAFQKYDINENKLIFVGFDNFIDVFTARQGVDKTQIV